MTRRGELRGGRELVGFLGEVAAFAGGGAEADSVAVEFAGEEDFIFAVPAGAGQAAGKHHGLKVAFAERDHLSAHLAAAWDFADIFALQLEVDRQRRIGGVGPDHLGLLVAGGAGMREHRATESHYHAS